VVQSPEECDDGNTTPADGCENDCKRSVIVQLAAGWTQSCVLFGTGQVRCWGGNDHGQLGLGNKQDQSASMPYQLGPIALGAQVTFLAAGYRHTCALTVDGSVQCWGRNDFGQLGLGHANDIGDDELPAVSVSKVPLGVSVKQLAAGGDTTCVLLDDDTVRCWGRNDFGQLGLGHTNNIGDNELPTAANAQVSLGGTAIGLAVAGDHTCALLATNDVRCWGDNRLGELGIGNTDNIGDDELPTAADTISFNDDGQLISITAGGYHTCVHEESSMLGSISRCWGYDGDGSLGVGFIADRPLALGNDWPYSSWNFPIVQLSCGAEHTCVYLYSHDLRCFGGNEVAQLGLPNIYSLGDVGPPIAASPIDFGVDAKGGPVYTILFATGALHNCAQVNTGDVHCWGMNADGQLGLGYSSPGQYGYVGGDPQSVPGKLPAVQIFPPGR
jgi:alpha-tubulin suppressor-like RCC1 family protein